MPRPGGNPDLKEHCFEKPAGVKQARDSLFAIRIEPEIFQVLKKINKEKVRSTLLQLVLEEGYEIPESITDYYHQF